jgi:spore maturation protein CgeB
MFIRQNSPKNFIKSLDLFDAYYSVDRGDIENKKITQRVNNCLLTNPTVNKNTILKNILNSSLDLSEINFIGYYDKKRIEYLSYLGNSGIKIKIYGTGWDLCKNKNYRNLSFYDAIYGPDYHNLINNSLVVINFLRDFTKDIINMKSIEIPAYGGLLLSEYTQYQAKLFQDNENVFYFSDKAELLKKINYIIDNKDKLDLIRNNALKVINGGKFATEDILEDIFLKL